MINYFKKSNHKNLTEISDKFCSNEVVCKQILELQNNKTTKIKLDKDIKNNYYVFITDTIYLSDKEVNKRSYQRICGIAHECIHSIQNKILQGINFALSNIELIVFVISFICIILKFNINIVFYFYIILNIISAIPRVVLEIDATLRSINLCKKYIGNVVNMKETDMLIKSYKTQILFLLPVFITSLLIGRIFRFLIIYIVINVIS
jgi:hypothetical protein